MINRTVLIVFSLLLFTSLCFSEGARYLIITPDNFYDAILPLAEWKTKKGMKAKVAKLSETGSSSNQIRSYIITAYNEWEPAPEYLLIVGDDNIIDMPSHGGAWDSDNYYTDIEGDIYNEIIPGRLPASNVNELNTMVSKTLGYERIPYMDDTLWFRKGTSIVRQDGGANDSVYWNDAYFAIGLMERADYVVIDTFSYYDGDNAGDVENAASDGRTFIQFRGQGVGNWWSPFGISPNAMNCGFKLPVVVSATCATFDGIGYSLLEAGTASSPKGAVGCAATSTICSGLACAQRRGALARGFANGMFRGAGTLGLACEDGRKNVYRIHNDSEEYSGFICLGDPELNLWTATPGSLCVTHPDVINLGITEATVNVRRADGVTPVYNALVCVMMDTTIYEYGYTDFLGDVTFLLNAQNIGDLSITVTARSRIPYESNIPVLPMGPYLIYNGSFYTDTLLGNGDSIINPGEKIRLDVMVKNMGNETAESVFSNVCIDTSYLMLLDSVILFGDIQPDSSVWGEDVITFLVSPDCPSGYSINLTLETFDSEGDSWDINVPVLNVNTGVLNWNESIVFDTLPGDDFDGVPDPGEVLHLYLSVENEGPSDLYGAEGFLRSNSDFVLIDDSVIVFDTIPSDSCVLSLNYAEITVSPLAVPGYDILFELYTTEDGSTYIHYDTILFSMEIGTIGTNNPSGPDDYGYYCYDNTDTMCSDAPVYDWYEIAPPGPGSVLSSITDEDARTTTISLPFNFKYYGNEFTTISICSNGFLAMGYTTYRFGDNSAIPDTHGPANMIAPFWFDLNPSDYGDIYEYYDETRHRWICEFEDCAHYSSPSQRETFEVILLDPQYYTTPTGDGEIIFQYSGVANLSTATVGIENSTEDIGMQYYYNYNYDPSAAPITNGRALKFSTNPPVSLSPWIFFYDYIIIDTLTGNNDGVPNPGEDFCMNIYFENLGNTTAYSLNATLFILDSLITAEDSVSIFGDIPAGMVGGNESDPYMMSILPDYEDSTACFHLYVESNGGDYVTIIPLTMEVGPPITGRGEGPYVFGLSQNCPNPMNTTTRIGFGIPKTSDVRIDVYNVAGMSVRRLLYGVMEAGRYSIVWDGRDDMGHKVPGGIYFYRIDTGTKTKTRKLVKVR